MNTTTIWTRRVAIATAAAALVVMSAGVANAAPGQGGGLSSLVQAGTISQSQLDAFSTEKRALKDSGMECPEATAQALSSLVASGVLTQADADAIAAAKSAKSKAAKKTKRGGAGTGSSGSTDTTPPVAG